MADETAPELTPFQRLIADFPRFIVTNRTTVPQFIALKDNNEVQVQGNATVTIDASDLHQIPDYTIFKLVEPKMKVIQQYGVYGDSTEDMVVGTVQETPAPSVLSDPVLPTPATAPGERVVPELPGSGNADPSSPAHRSSGDKPSTPAVTDSKKSKN